MNDLDDRPLALYSWAALNLLGQDKEAAPRRKPRAISATTSINPIDREHDVDCTSAPVTLTLETAVGCDGRWHVFKKTDSGSNAMTIAAGAGELIEGAASVNTTVQGITFMVWSTGATWRSVVLAPGTAPGVGTVTSVGLALPTSVFDISGSPVTSSGTLTATFDTQSANTHFSGPTSGGAATPTFRALVTADLPAGTGTVTSVALALPTSVFDISGSPVTGTGTLTGTFDTQSANTVFAGPTTGSAATPAFRALVTADTDGKVKFEGQYLLGDQTTALTTGTKLTVRWRGMTLTEVHTFLATAGTGATTFDLKDDGTSVFSTKPSIDSGEKTSTTGTAAVISNPTIGDHSEMTMILDAVGTGAAGFGFNFTFVRIP